MVQSSTHTSWEIQTISYMFLSCLRCLLIKHFSMYAYMFKPILSKICYPTLDKPSHPSHLRKWISAQIPKGNNKCHSFQHSRELKNFRPWHSFFTIFVTTPQPDQAMKYKIKTAKHRTALLAASNHCSVPLTHRSHGGVVSQLSIL